MKKFLSLCLIIGLGYTAHAQKNAIKLDLLSPVIRTGILSYERVVGPSSSVGISFLYTDQSGFWWEDYLTRIAITPEYRFYLSDTKPAPRGVYFLALLRYQQLSTTVEEVIYNDDFTIEPTYKYVDHELSTVGAGLGMGYQFIFKERIALDFHLGTIWNSGEVRDNPNNHLDEGNEYFEPYVGYFFVSGIKMGIAF